MVRGIAAVSVERFEKVFLTRSELFGIEFRCGGLSHGGRRGGPVSFIMCAFLPITARSKFRGNYSL